MTQKGKDLIEKLMKETEELYTRKEPFDYIKEFDVGHYLFFVNGIVPHLIKSDPCILDPTNDLVINDSWVGQVHVMDPMSGTIVIKTEDYETEWTYAYYNACKNSSVTEEEVVEMIKERDETCTLVGERYVLNKYAEKAIKEEKEWEEKQKKEQEKNFAIIMGQWYLCADGLDVKIERADSEEDLIEDNRGYKYNFKQFKDQHKLKETI